MNKKIKRERNSFTKTEIERLLLKEGVALAHKRFQEHFGSSCDRVTIYRALDRLVNEGKLHKIVNLDGVIEYALCNKCKNNNQVHNHEHVHFKCSVCNKTTCLEKCNPEIKLPSNYTAIQQQTIVLGTCPDCNKK
jgi:Fur family ferric uptake transcriptional regulator